MTRTVLLTIAALMAVPATAQEFTDENGIDYHLTCGPDGYALAPKNSGIVLYLGRRCEAQHDYYGSGKWCWGTGGFVAEFTYHQVGFPQQELICNPEPDYHLNCQCQRFTERR